MKQKAVGAYAHAVNGDYESILLFKGVTEDNLETVLHHESIHMALCHLEIEDRSCDILDTLFKIPMFMPLSMLLEIWLSEDSNMVEGLEACLEMDSESKKAMKTAIRKHHYVEL